MKPIKLDGSIYRIRVIQMKHIMAIFCLSISILPACSITEKNTEKYITAEQLHSKLNDSQLIIIDTRSKREFEKDHIPTARHIPFWKAAFSEIKASDCEENTLVLYCEHGPRAHISRLFAFCECDDVKILKGHMVGWREFVTEKQPVATDSK